MSGEDEDEEAVDDAGLLVELKRKLKDPSPVWENGAVPVEGGIKCSLCGKVYNTSTSNTSNVMEHIIKKHKNLPEGQRLKVAREDNRKRRKERVKIEAAKKAAKPKMKQTSAMTFFVKTRIDNIRTKKIDKVFIAYLFHTDITFQV